MCSPSWVSFSRISGQLSRSSIPLSRTRKRTDTLFRRFVRGFRRIIDGREKNQGFVEPFSPVLAIKREPDGALVAVDFKHNRDSRTNHSENGCLPSRLPREQSVALGSDRLPEVNVASAFIGISAFVGISVSRGLPMFVKAIRKLKRCVQAQDSILYPRGSGS